ncbi:unnamed protein product [Adineta steineri]|uniref:phosphatidate phosphatase n=1 Tax=Adineta steineri TaxID=433720 RepID=A0A814R1X2_9BILA|nr:unnamed protein product [Adineta steineri]CAF3671967.1 unnamed protein product [Adineta steineri]
MNIISLPLKCWSTIQSTYNSINPHNFSGAIDVIVIKQEDETLQCTPFHVRFGKLDVIQHQQKRVYVSVNDHLIEDLWMQLGDAGEAVFIDNTEADNGSPRILSNIDQSVNSSEQCRNHEKRRSTGHNFDVQSSEDEQLSSDYLLTKRQSSIRKRLSISKGTNGDEKDQSWTMIHRRDTNENDSLLFHMDDDNQISNVDAFSQKKICVTSPLQGSSNNNESENTDESGIDEQSKTEISTILSNQTPIKTSATVHIQESNTRMSEIYEAVLSKSAPIESHIAITDTPLQSPTCSLDDRVGNYSLNENLSSPPIFASSFSSQPTSLKSDTEYELDNSTQPLVKKRRSFVDRISGMWRWNWGKLPEQRQSATLTKPPNVLSYLWPSTKKTLPNEGIDLGDVQLSLCGNIDNLSAITHDIFKEHLVSHERFFNDSNIANDSNLVARIDGKLYKWTTAVPLITSAANVHKHLPTETVEQSQEKLIVQTVTNSSTIIPVVSTLSNRAEMKQNSIKSQPSVDKNNSSEVTKLVPDMEEKEISQPPSSAPTVTVQQTSLISPKKTLTLSSDQLKRLNLKLGINKIEFEVTTALQGNVSVRSNIFLFDYQTKFVISDIDGTITISDVMGQILPLIGRDWYHDGIAEFFNAIQENGYQFIYLSARAIGQSQMTRDFLRSIKQCKYNLPVGPLLLSPDSLLAAFHREVVAKQPEKFKIACLENIASLFPNRNPFYAGFGNRTNDHIAYTKIKIPQTRIFTINSHSNITRESLPQSMMSTNLHEVVDLIFPSMDSFSSSENYSMFTYWYNDPAVNTLDNEMQAHLNEIAERDKRAQASTPRKRMTIFNGMTKAKSTTTVVNDDGKKILTLTQAAKNTVKR